MPRKVIIDINAAFNAAAKDLRRAFNAAPGDMFTTTQMRRIMDAQDAILADLGTDIDRALRTHTVNAFEASAKSSTRDMQRQVDRLSRRKEYRALVDTGLAPQVPRQQIIGLIGMNAELVTRLSVAVKEKISRELQIGIINNESVAQVARRITTQVRGSGLRGAMQVGYSRAVTIAETELARAANLGRFEAMNATEIALRGNFVIVRRWIGTHDDRARTGHIEAESLPPKRLDETFRVRPETDGDEWEEMRYPLDPEASAANTVHCRCVTEERLVGTDSGSGEIRRAFAEK